MAVGYQVARNIHLYRQPRSTRPASVQWALDGEAMRKEMIADGEWTEQDEYRVSQDGETVFGPTSFAKAWMWMFDNGATWRDDLHIHPVAPPAEVATPTCPVCGKATRFEWVNRGNAAEPDPDLIAVCECGWSELEPPVPPARYATSYTCPECGGECEREEWRCSWLCPNCLVMYNDPDPVPAECGCVLPQQSCPVCVEAAAKAAGDGVPF